MSEFEKDLFRWIINAYPEERDALASQLSEDAVVDREFTDGGGVFIGLARAKEARPVSESFLGQHLRINGPEISSPQLEFGATTDVEFNDLGFVDYIEIWSMGSDYPPSRHPQDYRFSAP
jgi:hypothetical protein